MYHRYTVYRSSTLNAAVIHYVMGVTRLRYS
jgi:hypothetical protein